MGAAVGALPPGGDYFGLVEKRQPGCRSPVQLANLPHLSPLPPGPLSWAPVSQMQKGKRGQKSLRTIKQHCRGGGSAAFRSQCFCEKHDVTLNQHPVEFDSERAYDASSQVSSVCTSYVMCKACGPIKLLSEHIYNKK